MQQNREFRAEGATKLSFLEEKERSAEFHYGGELHSNYVILATGYNKPKSLSPYFRLESTTKPRVNTPYTASNALACTAHCKPSTRSEVDLVLL